MKPETQITANSGNTDIQDDELACPNFIGKPPFACFNHCRISIDSNDSVALVKIVSRIIAIVRTDVVYQVRDHSSPVTNYSFRQVEIFAGPSSREPRYAAAQPFE